MNANDLFDMIGETPERYVLDAANGAPAGRCAPKRLWLIAAIVAAMVFLMGCAVVYVIHMEDLKLGEQASTVPMYEAMGEGFTFVGNQQITSEILSISGLNGTPNYQAAKEWREFKKAYDPDNAIMNSVWGNYPEFPAAYDAYDPYSQEMVDKLDEIAEKYGLKLLGEKFSFAPDEIHLLPEALGIGSLLEESSTVEMNLFAGNCYEGGNFTLGIRLTMPYEEGQWPHEIVGDITYCRDDYFSIETIALDEAYEWEEWNYTTASGWNVLIIRAESHFHGWIICRRENDIITVKLEVGREAYTEENGEARIKTEAMTKRQMELVADVVNFGMEPTQPNGDQLREMLEK